MQASASKYRTTETISSFIVNGLLNLLSAWLLFRHRGLVPITGSNGLALDAVGETFIVTFLSFLVPVLIARSRRRKGLLPIDTDAPQKPSANPYLGALLVGLAFTVVLVPLDYLFLPKVLPYGATLRNVLVWKTAYGAVIGAIASFLAITRALHETESVK